ncbi:DUF2076 domain-containing protein [Buchnera aphidicola]|uniref:DUF2076 domain-containing protein n=1 Tax=Buchnera aphidicola TaxID=9 RepID=UPI0031B6EAC4
MQKEEKILIENLFKKIKKVESQSSQKDLSAEKLIKNMLEKQPNSIYYLTQIVLIQELAIEKMNQKIQLLNDKLQKKEKENNYNSKSFLFGCFDFLKNKKDNFKKKNENFLSDTVDKQKKFSAIEKEKKDFSQSTKNIGTNSFLANALQTAVGVASGIVIGNVLTNLFQHETIKDETINDINVSESVLGPDVSSNYINNSSEEKNQDYYDVNQNYDNSEEEFLDNDDEKDRRNSHDVEKHKDYGYEENSYENDDYEDDDNFI